MMSMTRLPCLISRATSKATPAWSGLGEIAHVIKMLRTISNRGKRLKVASTPPLAQAEYIGEPSRLPMPPAVDPSPSVTR